MKELVIYEDHQNNLCSIKSIKNNYFDNDFIKSIICKLLEITHGDFYVEASRPTYEYNTNDLVSRLRVILNNNHNMKYNDYEILFKQRKVEGELLEILPMIWFAYEHVTFSLFKESNIEFDTYRKNWNEITSKQNSYVLFKGIEEDVLWIGKSEAQSFEKLKMI